MTTFQRRAGSIALVLCTAAGGCSETTESPGEPGDPRAAEALTAHFEALKRGDWKAAYEQVHPDLKRGGDMPLTVAAFTQIQSKRRAADGLPDELRIVDSMRSGDDVIVAFDLVDRPAGGGEPVVLTPRRRATLREAGGVWRLMTHDLLALGSDSGAAGLPR